jgi:hypothetical protein
MREIAHVAQDTETERASLKAIPFCRLQSNKMATL